MKQNLTQEFECQEERGHTVIKTRKKFTGPHVGCFQERLNLKKKKKKENLHKTLANPEISRKVSQKTKFVDL